MADFLKKKRKVFLELLALIILLAAAVLLYLPLLANSLWFKQVISRQLTESLGRKVQLSGDLRLELGLTPKLAISDLLIENPKPFKPQPMLAVSELSISGPLFGNLTGKYQLDQISLRDVKVLVAEDAAAGSNWDFSDSSPRAEERNTGPIRLPFLKEMRLSAITVLIEKNGSSREISFDKVVGKNLNSLQTGSVFASLKVNGIPASLRAQLSSLDRFLKGEPLELDLSLKQKQLQLKVKGQLSKRGNAGFNLNLSANDLPALTPLLAVKLPQTGPVRIEGEFLRTTGDVDSLQFKNFNLTLAEKKISGSLDVQLAAPGTISGDIDLTSGAHQLKAKGGFSEKSGLALDIAASGPELSELSATFLTELPAWQDYSINGKLIWPSFAEDSFRLQDVKLRVGKNDLAGNMDLQLHPLNVAAELQSDSFDLGILRAISASESESSAPAEKEPGIPFDLFKNLKADIKFKAGSLTTFLDLKFKEAELAVKIEDGSLIVPRVAGRVFGGSFNGDLKAEDKILKVNLAGKDFEASPIMLLAGGKPILQGNFDWSANLSSKGELLPDILKTLSGSIRINSDNARINSRTLNVTASGLGEILSPLFGSSQEAESECLLFNYRLENGIAKSEEQVLKLNQVFIFGEGQLDFPQNEMTYNFNVKSSNPALASIIPPFRAFGKLNRPHFVPSVSGLVASVGDTAEGAADSLLATVKSAAKAVLKINEEKYSGVELCRKAYEAEQKMLSSRIGNLLESGKSPAMMHPSWDADKDGINDCEKEGSCDDSIDYSQPRQAGDRVPSSNN